MLSVQAIDSYWKPAFFNGSPTQHTGTITYRWANLNNQWVFQTYFMYCNHGTCPSDSTMSYYVTHWGPVSYYASVNPQECSGSYLMPHVCNNDTLLQQNNIKNNALYNTWGDFCGYTLYFAPGQWSCNLTGFESDCRNSGSLACIYRVERAQ